MTRALIKRSTSKSETENRRPILTTVKKMGEDTHKCNKFGMSCAWLKKFAPSSLTLVD